MIVLICTHYILYINIYILLLCYRCKIGKLGDIDRNKLSALIERTYGSATVNNDDVENKESNPVLSPINGQDFSPTEGDTTFVTNTLPLPRLPEYYQVKAKKGMY